MDYWPIFMSFGLISAVIGAAIIIVMGLNRLCDSFHAALTQVEKTRDVKSLEDETP